MSKPEIILPESSQYLIESIKAKDVSERLNGLTQELLTPNRIITLAIEAIYKNPVLAECEHLTVIGAFAMAASLGLEPNTPLGEAYLIPFSKWYKDKDSGEFCKTKPECNFQIGYRGFVKLIHRSNRIKTFYADSIRAGDHFRHMVGTNTILEYQKSLEERGEIRGSFCFIRTIDGGEDFTVLTKTDIEKIRLKSESYKSAAKAVEHYTATLEQAKSEKQKTYHTEKLQEAQARLDSLPWVEWDDEMSAKSAIKRHSKRAQLSPELEQAEAMDSLADVGKIDYRALIEARSRQELFDEISSQQKAALLTATNEEPLPVLNLDNVAGIGKTDAVAAKTQPIASSNTQGTSNNAFPMPMPLAGMPDLHQLANQF